MRDKRRIRSLNQKGDWGQRQIPMGFDDCAFKDLEGIRVLGPSTKCLNQLSTETGKHR